MRGMAEKLAGWFVLSGRTVIILAGLLVGLVAMMGILGMVRRSQVRPYAPINLMNGQTVAQITAIPSLTPAESDSALFVVPSPTFSELVVQPVITDAPISIPTTGLQVAAPTTEASSQPTNNTPAHSAITHVVQSGENLYRIALQYNLSTEEVAAANGITDVTAIYAGQELVIPVSAESLASLPFQPTIAPSVDDLGVTVVTPGPTPTPPTSINGVPVDTFAPLSESVIQSIRAIYATGQAMGRNPRAFSKLGDSTIENPHFLTRFDGGPYVLGDFAYLQPLIDQFAGSFGRQGQAVQRGLHSWSVMDPMWAAGCRGGDNMLLCEFQQQNPSFLIIHLTSNDVGVPDSTERSLREIVEFCIVNGVVPILGTKADRHEGSNINNEIIRAIADSYNLPLWDFDLVAGTLPGRGLDQDGTHMTSFFAHDWTSPLAFERGYGLMNITALMTLERVWRIATSS
jgi:LysM repeat protein